MLFSIHRIVHSRLWRSKSESGKIYRPAYFHHETEVISSGPMGGATVIRGLH